jgi:glycosyltransferase involved in cell wall biosynthesis
VEVLPWIHHEAYRLRRTLINADINLCPLVDNVFNRCKSAIKWYESTVSENTEATLAQNVGPYREIKDGETGLLFNTADEFVAKLSALIEDAQLRLRLGHAAKDWVWSNRLPKHTGPALFEFYRDLKDRQMAELSPKIITTIPRSLKEVVGGNT